MAVGTNYDGVRSMFATTITDPSKYLWDGKQRGGLLLCCLPWRSSAAVNRNPKPPPPSRKRMPNSLATLGDSNSPIPANRQTQRGPPAKEGRVILRSCPHSPPFAIKLAVTSAKPGG